MEILKYIVNYLIIGAAFVGGIDLLTYLSRLPNPITNSERIVMILIFPFTITVFVVTYIKTSRNKDK